MKDIDGKEESDRIREIEQNVQEPNERLSAADSELLRHLAAGTASSLAPIFFSIRLSAMLPPRSACVTPSLPSVRMQQ